VNKDIAEGIWDVGLGVDPPPKLVEKFASDPRLHTGQIGVVNYIAINLAIPPFNDVHVRRALSLALDKQELVRRSNDLVDVPSFAGVATRHLIPDALEEYRLEAWRPAWDTAPDEGDLGLAREEMLLSNYDRDGDGLCDGSACDHAVFVVDDPYPSVLLTPMREALRAIGIRFNLRRVPRDSFGAATGPTKHIALSANRWFVDFPSGSNIFPELFYGPNLSSGGQDPSLLGATPEELAAWGYRVDSVASADDAIDRCLELIGQSQVECWTKLDQTLMGTVVPWIPWMFQTASRLVSPRVVNYSFDQFASEPALDQLALEPS